MNPEQQRIAIAEACPSIRWFELQWCWYSRKLRKWVPCVDNDLLRDLNAMHEAEKHFIGDAPRAMTYATHLLRINGQNIDTEDDDLNCDHAWITAFATASQRAEAFLKTIGKWEAPA